RLKVTSALKRGDIGELTNLHGLGRMLVALRIALGFTQRELAERLGVHESQVSRDERNEYHGITVEHVSRILDALAMQLTSRFDDPIAPRSSPASHNQAGRTADLSSVASFRSCREPAGCPRAVAHACKSVTRPRTVSAPHRTRLLVDRAR